MSVFSFTKDQSKSKMIRVGRFRPEEVADAIYGNIAFINQFNIMIEFINSLKRNLLVLYYILYYIFSAVIIEISGLQILNKFIYYN